MATGKKIIEPKLQSTVTSDGATALPEDIVEAQCARLMLLAAVGAVVWSVGFVMHRWVLPAPDESMHGVVIDGLAVVASLLLLAYVHFSP